MCVNAQLDSRPRGAVSTSAMSSSDVDPENSLLHIESNTESLAAIQPKLYRFEGLHASPHAQGNNRSQPWVVGPHHVCCRRPSLSDAIV